MQPLETPSVLVADRDRLGAGDEWTGLLFDGGEPLRSSITRMPYEEWSQDPAMLLALAGSYRWDGLRGAYVALPHLDAADRLLHAQDKPDQRFAAAASLMRGIATRAQGRMSETLQHTQRAIDVLRSPDVAIRDRIDLSAIAVIKRGSARLYAADLTAARHDLRAGLLADEDALPVLDRLEALGLLAIVDMLAGSIRAAERTLAQARALLDDTPPGLWRAPAAIAALLLAAERCELAGRSREVHELLRSTEGSEFEPFAVHLFALLRQAQGDWEEAMDAVHRLREIEREWDGAELLRLLRASDRAEVYLGAGNLAQMRQALAQEKDPGHLICMDAFAARLAIELGDFEGAIAHTQACSSIGEDHPVRSQLYAFLLDAGAHWAVGDMRSADASFRLVVRQSLSMGLRRVFLALPPHMLHGLAARALERGDLTREERELLEAFAANLPPELEPTSDPLSPREQVILMRIAAGETPKEIASSLRVSLNTVKTQVRSLYRKLGASTRAGAVERARTLGVIGC